MLALKAKAFVAEVTYLGKLRKLAGVTKEQVDQPQVSKILKELAGCHGPELRGLLFTNGDSSELNGDIEVLVNGRNINFLDGLATTLGEEDRVTILYHGARGFPGG